MTGGIWILAEQYQNNLETVSFELLTRALKLKQSCGKPICAVLFAPPEFADDELRQLLARGADHVLCVTSPSFSHFALDTFKAAFLRVVKDFQPDMLIAGATSTGRTLLPACAMTIRTGLTADCTELGIEDETGLLLQTRPAIGGNIMATIKCADFRPQMATVRPRSTRPAPVCRDTASLPADCIERIPVDDVLSSRYAVRSFTPSEETAGIQSASRVVVVGRGIKRPETLPMIRQLAELLGATVGGTREVVDRGWLDYPCQVGLSGKTITPDFYLGIGVSGAIQHLAGMQTSGTIAAINSDADAAIFKVADYGICGNLFEVVPALIKELQEGKSSWLKK